MFLTSAATLGLIVWIVLWALSGHGILSFIPTILIVLVAATVKVLLPYLPSNRGND